MTGGEIKADIHAFDVPSAFSALNHVYLNSHGCWN